MSIYIITNTVTGKVYVGKTDRKPMYRKHHHWFLLRHGRHFNKDLQADFATLGEGAFDFDVIEDGMDEAGWVKAFPEVYNQIHREGLQWKANLSKAGTGKRNPKVSTKLSKPCTVDGVTIFPSLHALTQALGRGKHGSRSPTFRYLA